MASDILSGINPNYLAPPSAATVKQAQAANPDFAKQLLDLYGADPSPTQTPPKNLAATVTAEAATAPTPLQVTIHPETEHNLSPYQQRQEKPYDVVNNDFFGSGSALKSVVDTINPLQQLPIVSSIYREMTGDTISTGARLAGGALLGGPIGFALALVNEMVSGATGKDIGENMYAAITDKYKATEALT